MFNRLSVNSVQTEWTFPNGTPSSATGVGPVFVTYDGFGSYEVVVTETASNGCQVTEIFNNFHVVEPYTSSIVPDILDGCVPLNVNYTALFNNLPTGKVFSPMNGIFLAQLRSVARIVRDLQ